LDKSNPLFARVAVNRLWQWHFGTGLVKTSSDFGALSEPPSHPELLDWLATKFVESGYSMKAIHRLIVTSRTYQLASEPSADNLALDPDNVLLWRMPVRRLTAEELRDAILSLAGKLDLKVGGKSFTELPDQYFVGSRVVIGNFDREVNRRGVYMARGYNSTAEMMSNYLLVFDVDNGKMPCPMRNRSVTALQALTAMNSPLVDQAARDFGKRLWKDSKEDISTAIDLGYLQALSRLPTSEEKRTSLDYLRGIQGPSESHGLDRFGWLLMNLDEFMFVR